jgi:hypothetical protein
MATSGISWLRQESYDYVRESLGYVRNLMAISGISRLHQESHGYVRNLMATSGISWLRQESHGYVRNLMAATEEPGPVGPLCFIPVWTPMIFKGTADPETKGLVLQRWLSLGPAQNFTSFPSPPWQQRSDLKHGQNIYKYTKPKMSAFLKNWPVKEVFIYLRPPIPHPLSHCMNTYSCTYRGVKNTNMTDCISLA